MLWLTGLSGAGKSTIARRVERELLQCAVRVCVLDGDELRSGLCSDLGFSPQDRSENIRRVAEMARIIVGTGCVVIVALISPFREDRLRARGIINEAGHAFIEVFVNAPLEVCKQRDPKNLYAKACAGQLKDFTGIDSPYEPPLHPEAVLFTERQTVDESAQLAMACLKIPRHPGKTMQELPAPFRA